MLVDLASLVTVFISRAVKGGGQSLPRRSEVPIHRIVWRSSYTKTVRRTEFMHTKSFSLVLLAMLASIILAACGGGTAATPTQAPAAPPTAAAAATAAPEPTAAEAPTA